ncbi:MAG: cyclic nucleotide-binding domain-containing protein [Saprospiraceae bacterium]|nr:cyclic nucleotide-binding domain-containing protein [Saprospiraceae bacterium]
MDNIIDMVLALKNVSIFQNLPDHVLADIAEITKVGSIDKGTTFIKKGDLGEEMYIIKSGVAQIHDGEHVITNISENQIVGELAILAPVQRTADVTALEDMTVFIINRDYFSDLLAEEFEIVSGVMVSLVDTIIQNNNIIKEFKTSRTDP